MITTYILVLEEIYRIATLYINNLQITNGEVSGKGKCKYLLCTKKRGINLFFKAPDKHKTRNCGPELIPVFRVWDLYLVATEYLFWV